MKLSLSWSRARIAASALVALCIVATLYFFVSRKRSEYPPPGTWTVATLKEHPADKTETTFIDGRFVKAVGDWIVIEEPPEEGWPDRQFWLDRKNILRLVFFTRELGPMKK